MKKYCLLYFFSCILVIPGISQLEEFYPVQKDDTILKRGFLEQTQKIKQNLLGTAIGPYAKDYKEVYDRQFEEIDGLFSTSRSVTDPRAYQYLQSVLQNIIVANPELKSLHLRVVFSRDWWPNASSMGEGTIVVNAGLVVYLESEAQLAFVLCHELAHYYLDHTNKEIKKYVETMNSEAVQQKLKTLSKQEYGAGKELELLEKSLIFDNRLHSRNNEAEADMQGLKFMKKTGYDCYAVKTCLQILDKVDDSSLFKPLDLAVLLNFDEYPFKKKWIEKESAIFSQLHESDSPFSQKEKDSLKTHPDCSKRVMLLEDSLQTQSRPGKVFLVDEKIFQQVKRDFLIELTQQCYDANSLSRNLYYSLMMVQSNENLPFAIYSVARCLNRVYEKQANHKLGTAIDLENKRYPNDYNLLLRLLSRIRLDELANINSRFCKKYYEQMKDYPAFIAEIKKFPQIKN